MTLLSDSMSSLSGWSLIDIRSSTNICLDAIPARLCVMNAEEVD